MESAGLEADNSVKLLKALREIAAIIETVDGLSASISLSSKKKISWEDIQQLPLEQKLHLRIGQLPLEVAHRRDVKSYTVEEYIKCRRYSLLKIDQIGSKTLDAIDAMIRDLSIDLKHPETFIESVAAALTVDRDTTLDKTLHEWMEDGVPLDCFQRLLEHEIAPADLYSAYGWTLRQLTEMNEAEFLLLGGKQPIGIANTGQNGTLEL